MKSLAVVVLALAACGGKPSSGGTAVVGPDPSTADAPAPPCTAADVVADWSTNSGSDFESITIEEGGRFSSYLHDRPFYLGTWRLDGGTLILSTDDGTTIEIADARCQYTNLTGTTDGAAVKWTAIQPGAI